MCYTKTFPSNKTGSNATNNQLSIKETYLHKSPQGQLYNVLRDNFFSRIIVMCFFLTKFVIIFSTMRADGCTILQSFNKPGFKKCCFVVYKGLSTYQTSKDCTLSWGIKKSTNPYLGKPSNSGYNCKEMVKGYFPKKHPYKMCCGDPTQWCRAALIIVEVKMFLISLSFASSGKA